MTMIDQLAKQPQLYIPNIHARKKKTNRMDYIMPHENIELPEVLALRK